MGLLVDGKWQDRWNETSSTKGRFVRQESQFRNWITADGAAGPSGEDGFKAEAGRYHLYVAYACPWAHRTLIFRALKGLESFISLSVVNWFMGAEGWTFAKADGVLPAIRAAVGSDLPLIADGGVRSGLDVARLIACGADFVLMGRAFVYAVAAAGEAGVDHAVDILTEELRHTLAQAGCERLSELASRRC